MDLIKINKHQLSLSIKKSKKIFNKMKMIINPPKHLSLDKLELIKESKVFNKLILPPFLFLSNINNLILINLPNNNLFNLIYLKKKLLKLTKTQLLPL